MLTAPGWEIPKYCVSHKTLASLAVGTISDVLLFTLLASSRWDEDLIYNREAWHFFLLHYLWTFLCTKRVVLNSVDILDFLGVLD